MRLYNILALVVVLATCWTTPSVSAHNGEIHDTPSEAPIVLPTTPIVTPLTSTLAATNSTPTTTLVDLVNSVSIAPSPSTTSTSTVALAKESVTPASAVPTVAAKAVSPPPKPKGCSTGTVSCGGNFVDGYTVCNLGTPVSFPCAVGAKCSPN
ncbi:hypothetical protein IWQ60_003692, partial [Tieghemiomyces parasiticus]